MNPFLIQTLSWSPSLTEPELCGGAVSSRKCDTRFGRGVSLPNKGPQGFVGQIQFPDPEGCRRLSLLCVWNGQGSRLVHRRLWPTSRAQAGRNYPRAEFGLLMSNQLQELQGVMLLLFLFVFFFFPPISFFSSFQEHPGKSFRVLYFHLSPGLLWTAEVIVWVNFRDLKGSNLKAFDWKCKLQLESCQVLLDGTWRDAAAEGIPAAGTTWTYGSLAQPQTPAGA